MSEFQDFLKRRFAYVAIGEFKPGKFDEACSLYEEAVSTYGQGFEGTFLLQEPGTDRGISIIFWDSPADMEANRSQEHEAILKKMKPLFAKPPEVTFYEVVCDVQPSENGRVEA
ncbi:antibiotic biosynthesis monooxygenase [Leptolyngbya sp. FACHB-711]|jgi:heme-degrading monooxygenase HmoA|uniref:antibiotic biosynthesis monooxygenase family protein n=1 Tax=unclassified Leptolyngbya TaxID=2650499 RepID=UPI0016867589|nr:antibiotic biosynthesis monooxygenase [Leptolyngbya sp. FACHB-711]MBD1850675.1 antibiotic biosynthesis monooxygenase [Cyanobacteria bacterium FACHB-502]MBD2027532.1 antibiotic biosynthesis monooxygenase [Leptolyngbya sp. FACHB-711]